MKKNDEAQRQKAEEEKAQINIKYYVYHG